MLQVPDKAREIVAKHAGVPLDRTFVVWSSKTLQNWKALVATDRRDGLYFEVTYNGDQNITYLDTYEKLNNQVIKD